MAAELKQKPKAPKNKKTGRGKETPPEVVATIINCFLSGEFTTDKEIATHTGVSSNTVGRIRSKLPVTLKTMVDSVNDRGARIDTLVFEFIAEGFESLKRISQVTADGEWLKKQTAVELATLYGVKADRNIKILELIDRANQPAEQSEELIPATED